MNKFKIFSIFILISNTALAFKIVVISDLNGSYGSTKYSDNVHQAVESIIKEKPDLILSTGDMVAGQKKELDYQKMWNSFHQSVTDKFLQNHLTFVPSIGNHDGSAYPNYKEERELYIKEWNKYKPSLEYLDDSHYPLYFSFTKMNILFIALDSTKTDEFDKKQLLWLEKQLITNQKFKTKILFGHVPYYQIVESKNKMNFESQEFIEILKKYNVQFFLTGHQHAFYPGFDGVTLHLSQACLGSGPRSYLNQNELNQKSYTLIETNNFKTYHINTKVAPEFSSSMDINSIPLEIKSDKSLLIRNLKHSI
jgi:predicted MPP superfamily phosphohydrolase